MRDWSRYVVPVTRLEAFKALKFVVARLEDCRVLKLYKMESFRALKCSRFESFMTLKFFTLESFGSLKFKIVPDMAHILFYLAISLNRHIGPPPTPPPNMLDRIQCI